MFKFLRSLFYRPALHKFTRKHPPSRQVTPAPAERIESYRDILPASLLELWQRKGFGFYGNRQLALIDPSIWQPVLDRWIISPPGAAVRVPIAMTPFGILLYYRRLTDTEEDVAYFDPVSKETDVLTWKLDDFFNGFLCDTRALESLIPAATEKIAREENGLLATGEAYEINQMLLTMQMLQIKKVDAAAMHHRLRDAVDPPKKKGEEPNTLVQAIPDAYRDMFADSATGDDLTGLYLSSYSDWYRLLALQPGGQYRLLFWRIHYQTFERTEVRSYAGPYKIERNANGDIKLVLDIRLRGDSLGSDARDDELLVMPTGGETLLLQFGELKNIATAIGGRGTIGSSKYYFRRVTPEEALSENSSDDRAAPPLTDLPQSLRELVHVEPVMPRITHVAEPVLDEEDDGEGTVMCTLDLGEEDGLRHNMPLYSPAHTDRHLIGWIWGMAPHACQVGVRYKRGEDGTILHGPRVGDLLTTRSPKLDRCSDD
ncbi:hypothetical protein GAO09_28325 [Rhizobiales bacterium RZME27]|uniref:GAD-related domain-containing protein n=1 Tax=Endobacterium cereale TaxID=2663029 RepID=A0A6A8AGN2_9HYPH|nr:GAD-like domain-containing protein [Endobacterium cereale]MEB2844666.1 GAD-like domain-containing protein [Endobacterium cereale]MQY49939.1 hypothetical protein [Endobacterium cereale]